MGKKKELTSEQKKKRAEYARMWRKNNPEKVAEHAKRTRIKNKEKIKQRQKEWRENNRAHVSEKGKKWYIENVDRVRNNQLKLHFGISLEKYNKILDKQNGVCAVCGSSSEKRKFSVDHDHETGKIRGLLCRGCNVGIGNLKDDIIVIENALNYLKKHKE